MKSKKERSLVGMLFKKLARKAGVKVHLEPRYGYVGQIETADGRKRYFRGSRVDINTLGATEIAVDKDYAAYFMQRMGYPVPRSTAFYSETWAAILGEEYKGIDAAWKFACEIGLPVIVKPNSRTQGAGVFKAETKRDFYRAFKAAARVDKIILVQEALVGRDYRIVILDDSVISAYERTPLRITGDGVHTIRELLALKQKEFEKAGRDTILKPDDWRIGARLKRRGLTFASILASGETLTLLDNANLSTGGDAMDVTEQLHPDFRDIAIALTRDMGLRLCGVDLMIKGSASEAPQDYWVLEINAAPGLDNYFAQGKKQERIVEGLYLEILRSINRS